jgi:hypothetical protein
MPVRSRLPAGEVGVVQQVVDQLADHETVVELGRHGDWRCHQRGSVACRSGPAAEAYVGAPFTVNRRYAEQTGGDWSAGYPGLSLGVALQRP